MRVIQVPMQEDEVLALTERAKALKLSRSDLIRQACRAYLENLRNLELEQQYVEGYCRLPEDPALAQACAELAGRVLPAEDWTP